MRNISRKSSQWIKCCNTFILIVFLLIAGNLVIEKPAAPAQPPGVLVGGPPVSPGQGHPSKHPGQINLAQLRLQHMQQAVYAQKQQQHQQHQQHQQIQQQMRIASQMSQQHARQGGPPMVQQVLKTLPKNSITEKTNRFYDVLMGLFSLASQAHQYAADAQGTWWYERWTWGANVPFFPSHAFTRTPTGSNALSPAQNEWTAVFTHDAASDSTTGRCNSFVLIVKKVSFCIPGRIIGINSVLCAGFQINYFCCFNSAP